jgi:hypothetical protein
MMELLIVVAIKLASEIKNDCWRQFSNIEQQPAACLAIINELQSRIQGYDLSDYVKAMAYAINTKQQVAY